MKRLKWLLLVVFALILGISIGIYRIAGVENSPYFFKNGSWRGSKNIPMGKDDLLTAQVTVFALFALPSQEALYLFALRDEKNERFNGSNNYTIKGNIHDIKAHYWSITAYGKDLYLIPNEAERFSFNNQNLVTDSAGNYTITVSDTQQGDNWLPVATNAKFNLVLRIYKGEPEYLAGLEKATLPEIKRVNE